MQYKLHHHGYYLYFFFFSKSTKSKIVAKSNCNIIFFSHIIQLLLETLYLCEGRVSVLLPFNCIVMCIHINRKRKCHKSGVADV